MKVSSLLLLATLYTVNTSAHAQQAISGPGTIVVDIWGGRKNHHLQYRIEPANGSIRLLKEEIITRDAPVKNSYDASQKSAESAWDCNTMDQKTNISPDGLYKAQCEKPSLLPTILLLSDAKTSTILRRWQIKHRRLQGFAWSPNLESVAILNTSEYESVDPLGLLAGLSGHPIPHLTIFLDIVDISTGNTTEYLIRKNVLYGSTRIFDWTN